jgi:hypothetical protein
LACGARHATGVHRDTLNGQTITQKNYQKNKWATEHEPHRT